jgi:hypothetical protein
LNLKLTSVELTKALTQLDEPAIQTIVCVSSETDAIKLKAADTEKWLGTTVAGALTVLSFHRPFSRS